MQLHTKPQTETLARSLITTELTSSSLITTEGLAAIKLQKVSLSANASESSEMRVTIARSHIAQQTNVREGLSA